MQKKTSTKNKKASQGHLFKNIRCITGEVAEDYTAYLRTKHWQGLRLKIAERDKNTCQRCKGIFNTAFTIHYNTYKYLGDERLKDLTFYCSKCHAVIHNDRKNTHAFNRSYNALIRQKMYNMDEEQIEKVLEFMESLLAKPSKPLKKPPLTCHTCGRVNAEYPTKVATCNRCLSGKNLPYHSGRVKDPVA